jgi:xylose isomerase
MLNADLKQQLQQLLQLMEGDVEFRASIGSDDKILPTKSNPGCNDSEPSSHFAGQTSPGC